MFITSLSGKGSCTEDILSTLLPYGNIFIISTKKLLERSCAYLAKNISYKIKYIKLLLYELI